MSVFLFKLAQALAAVSAAWFGILQKWWLAALSGAAFLAICLAQLRFI